MPDLLEYDRQLELVVELLGQVLRIDHRIVGTDDRVHVLEEVDPRCDVVRPVDVLRLGLVLAEVARRVEELLGRNRRPQPNVGEPVLGSGLIGAPVLEIGSHRRSIEL